MYSYNLYELNKAYYHRMIFFADSVYILKAKIFSSRSPGYSCFYPKEVNCDSMLYYNADWFKVLYRGTKKIENANLYLNLDTGVAILKIVEVKKKEFISLRQDDNNLMIIEFCSKYYLE